MSARVVRCTDLTPTDLDLPKLSAIRAAVDLPLRKRLLEHAGETTVGRDDRGIIRNGFRQAGQTDLPGQIQQDIMS